MDFVDLDGVRTCYRHEGTGPRLMVLNGTGSDLRNKPSVFDGPLAKRFELLSLDHRGLGQSQPTDPDAQPTMADFANDALALATHLGWDNFALMGISFGGMVAQEIAIRGGQRITRMVLACTSSGGPGNPSYPLHEVYAGAPSQADTDMISLMDTRTDTDPELRKIFESVMSSRRDPAETPPGLTKQLEARRHHDTWDRLPNLEVPTLVAGGLYDAIAPVVNLENLASRIPGATLQFFDGGHGFFVQDRTSMTVIADFLAAES